AMLSARHPIPRRDISALFRQRLWPRRNRLCPMDRQLMEGKAISHLLSGVKKNELRALIRYGAVGIAQNLAMYAVTLGFIWAGLKAWQVTALLYPVATAISFIANRSWSFEDRTRRRGDFLRYVAVYVAVYPAAIALNWVQETASVPSWMASLITLIIGAIVIFLALNYWVFRKY